MQHNLLEGSEGRLGESYCSVCRGVMDVSLPTDCPGRPLSADEQDQIIAGIADFEDGIWFNPEDTTLEKLFAAALEGEALGYTPECSCGEEACGDNSHV